MFSIDLDTSVVYLDVCRRHVFVIYVFLAATSCSVAINSIFT